MSGNSFISLILTKKSKLIFLSLIIFNAANICPISLVYNLKIRRVFRVNKLLGTIPQKPFWVPTVLPIVYKRDRHIVNDILVPTDICENRLTDGAILNLRYIRSKNWWLEATTGIETEHVRSDSKISPASSFKTSKTGLDDIVFSGGYNFFPTQDLQIDLYALTGFPTNRKITLFDAQDPLVGTRFYSLGVGSEFSYSFINQEKRNVIFVFQNRFIHFFNRYFYPVLPVGAKIQPGNVTDLLFTLEYRFKFNLLEAGYNPTFFSNQAILLPTREIKSHWFVRNSFYANFNHLFKRCPGINVPIVLGAGLNIGRLKLYDTKIFAAWVNLTAIF